jgi:hypothetical protein
MDIKAALPVELGNRPWFDGFLSSPGPFSRDAAAGKGGAVVRGE